MHSNHHLVPHFLLHKKVNTMYFAIFFMNAAESLITVFIPIYLFTHGYSVARIIGFFVLGSLGSVILAIPAAHIVSKLSPKRALFLSTPFLILYYVGLRLLPELPALFWILPWLVASRTTLYNLAFSLHFLAHTDHKKMGTAVSLVQIMAIAGSALAPLIAALVIRFSSYHALMIVGAALLVMSLIPLLLSKVTETAWPIRSREIVTSLADRKNRNMQLSFAGYAIESSISRVVWPVFLIMIVGTVVRVGYIVTIATILTVIGLYLIGKLTDKYRGSMLLKVGTGFYFVGWLLSILVDNPLKMFFIETYRSMSARFLIVPWSAAFYRSIVPEKYFAQIVMQDLLFNLSRIIVLPLIMLVFVYLSHPFIITFVIASLFTLLYPLARERE